MTSGPETAEGVPSTHVTFAVKAMRPGSWSHRLLRAADTGSLPPTVRVDGPFGCLARNVYQYEDVTLLGGGIGATPMVSLLQHLCSGAPVASAVKKLTFVWVGRSLDDLAWCLPVLASVRGCTQPHLSIFIHVTQRSLPTKAPVWEDVLVGRPNVELYIKGLPTTPADTEEAATGRLVVACGPEGLLMEAHRLCAANNVTFVHETFLL